MSRLLVLAAIAVCWWVAYDASPALAIAAAVFGLPAWAALYVASLHRRPYLPCGRCAGTDRNYDQRGPWRRYHSHCRRCHGHREYLRLGCRVLGIHPDR